MTDAIDIVGGHNATIEGAIDVQVGQVGNKFVGDGATVLTVPKHADFDQGRFTIMGWVDTVSATLQTIIANWKSADDELSGFRVDVTATGKLDFYVAKNSGNVKGTDYENVESPLAISDGERTFVAVRYDGKTMDLFVDGLIVATAPWTGGVVYDVDCLVTLLGLGAVAVSPIDMLYWWTFDDADIILGDKYDNKGSSGSGDHVLNTDGTPTPGVVGQIGEAVLLDDPSDGYSGAGFTESIVSNSCWFKTTQTTMGVLYGTWRNRDGGFHGFQVRTEVTGFIQVRIGDGTGTTFPDDYDAINATTVTNDGAWHHLAWSYDNATLVLLIDGVEEASKSLSNLHNQVVAQAFTVGRDAGSGGDDYDGYLDDLKYWDRKVENDEFTAMFVADGGLL